MPKELTEEEKKDYDALTIQMLTLLAGELPEIEMYKMKKIEQEEIKAKEKKQPKKGEEVPEVPPPIEITPETVEKTELPERRVYSKMDIVYNHDY
jgi:hypothetical protein